jgi:hypothetical protein
MLPSLLDSNQQIPQQFLKLMSWLINSNLVSTFAQAWRLFQHMLRAQMQEGTYELLEHRVELELCDTKGKRSIYRRFQHVKFLQNNIIAFQDQAWGDGKIFADYKCSPGVPVDRYREGNITRVLISLRGTRNRDDEEQFRIERTIEDGFPEAVEILQTDVIVRTQFLSISVIFPAKRFPQSVKLIERNTTKGIYLGEGQMKKLPDGRLKVIWETHRPRLFESYLLRWEW